MSTKNGYFWFRRDLRLEDNAGLYHALKSKEDVQCVFIFDKNILDKLVKNDPRVTFIYQEVKRIKDSLVSMGSDLSVYYGEPLEIWEGILSQQSGDIFYNEDYESYAMERDRNIHKIASTYHCDTHAFKDHVIFAKNEVLKDDGNPYTVFTPYKRKWLAALKSSEPKDSYYFSSYPSMKYKAHFSKKATPSSLISLVEMGFEKSSITIPEKDVPQKIIKEYSEKRNFPAVKGTSKLGIHFRFGTISIREKARKASVINETYLSELIWRDFYSQILHHFPHVEKNAFRKKYEAIPWRNNEIEFKSWCEGQTGYPIVDAGMRELNATGYMHNRVRMIVASFLTKHLLIDWRWGEQYFADKLLDFDLASNNGGWQWASGSGTDAAPYFRIFNPTSQLTKFDKQLEYVKKWVPEYGSEDYVAPIVDHKEARERCLQVYKTALNDPQNL